MNIMMSVILLSASLNAQLPGSGWIAGSDSFAIEYYDNQWNLVAFEAGVGTAMSVDEHGVLFVSDGTFGLRRWDYDPVNGFGWTQLMQAWFGNSTFLTPRSSQTGCLAALRDGVWLQNSSLLARANKNGVNQDPPVMFDIAAALGVPLIRSGCSDGREIFFVVPATSLIPPRICAVDIRSNPMVIRTVAVVTQEVGQLLLVGDGRVLFTTYPSLNTLDPVSGAVSSAGVSWPPGSAFQATFRASFAYDPWSDTLSAVPSRAHGIATCRFAGGPWALIGTFGLMLDIVSTSERPFELFGAGCNNGTSHDPRMRWQGLPAQGQAFTLTLHDAEPGAAFFWLGLSNTFWLPVGTLPFDASPYGAPGCPILVSADVPYVTVVDSNGRASLGLSIPMNPTLAGLNVFAQTASTSTANNLGLATSDALAIRVR